MCEYMCEYMQLTARLSHAITVPPTSPSKESVRQRVWHASHRPASHLCRLCRSILSVTFSPWAHMSLRCLRVKSQIEVASHIQRDGHPPRVVGQGGRGQGPVLLSRLAFIVGGAG